MFYHNKRLSHILGVFASVLQDAIPEGFCRRHIRMVAGILGFVAGAGTVAAGFIGGKCSVLY